MFASNGKCTARLQTHTHLLSTPLPLATVSLTVRMATFTIAPGWGLNSGVLAVLGPRDAAGPAGPLLLADWLAPPPFSAGALGPAPFFGPLLVVLGVALDGGGSIVKNLGWGTPPWETPGPSTGAPGIPLNEDTAPGLVSSCPVVNTCTLVGTGSTCIPRTTALGCTGPPSMRCTAEAGDSELDPGAETPSWGTPGPGQGPLVGGIVVLRSAVRMAVTTVPATSMPARRGSSRAALAVCQGNEGPSLELATVAVKLQSQANEEAQIEATFLLCILLRSTEDDNLFSDAANRTNRIGGKNG